MIKEKKAGHQVWKESFSLSSEDNREIKIFIVPSGEKPHSFALNLLAAISKGKTKADYMEFIGENQPMFSSIESKMTDENLSQAGEVLDNLYDLEKNVF